jgi:RNA polymerase sigma-70 factor (ECF subfamily)
MSTAYSGTTPPQGTLSAAQRDRWFREIYDREFGYVWSTLKRFGVWERELEDGAHEVFLVVHRRLHEFDRSRPLKPWLCGIAFRVASDFRRRAQNRREVVSDEVVAVDTQRASDGVVADKESKALVHAALDTLDTDKRAVFVLHELEGYAMPEIALIVEAPLNTCYSRLRLARERFADAVRTLTPRPRGAAS